MGTQIVAHPENGSFGPKRGGNAGRPATTWLNFKTASSERRRTRRPHLVWLFSQGVFLTGKSADRKWAVAAGAGGGKKGAATPRPGVFFWRGTAGSERRRLHSTERFNAAAARCVHFTSVGRSRRDGCPPSRAPPARPARKSRPSTTRLRPRASPRGAPGMWGRASLAWGRRGLPGHCRGLAVSLSPLTRCREHRPALGCNADASTPPDAPRVTPAPSPPRRLPGR